MPTTGLSRGSGTEQVTLERLLSVVGRGSLEVYSAPRGLTIEVQGVAVWDPQEPRPAPGQVVLAVGMEPQSLDAADLVRAAGRCGAAAVIFRHVRSGVSTATLHHAAADAGVAVLFRTGWVGWAQLVGALRAGLTAAGVPADPDIAQVALGDLDGLAEAVAALVGGAVTIEDVRSRVLAYSTTDADVDEIRRLTILGRRVPRWRVAALREAGFFSALWGSGDVVHRPAEGGIPERLAIAVVAAGEVLGSIWVASVGQPFPADSADALRRAARAAAPHLLHHRSCRTGEAHLIQDAARALLDGHGSAEVLAIRAGVPLEAPCAVIMVCAEPRDPDQASGVESGRTTPGSGGDPRSRLHDILALYSAAHGHQAFIVPKGRDALVLICGLATGPDQAAAQVARRSASLAQQLSADLGTQVRIGVGETASRLDQAPASRHSAELALRAMRFTGSSRGTGRVGELAEAVALLRIMDTLREVDVPRDTPVRRLADYDAEHGGSALVDTLRAYLDHFGHIPAASRALGVHPNTFRYRVRRLRDVCGIDLDNPNSRLLADLQLRLLGHGGSHM
ncbi:PucR family transcriptional regulator [Streptomyces sp. NPDC098781]|uniref:PucR family transcriptional regulator n=1 Tax=Streptomyces sp. NPDC098781 TaxID=3366097 RepID=UPI0037FEAFC1